MHYAPTFALAAGTYALTPNLCTTSDPSGAQPVGVRVHLEARTEIGFGAARRTAWTPRTVEVLRDGGDMLGAW